MFRARQLTAQAVRRLRAAAPYGTHILSGGRGAAGVGHAVSVSKTAFTAALTTASSPLSALAPKPTAEELAAANETMDTQLDSPEVIKRAIDTLKLAAAHGSAQAKGRVGRWYLLGICGCKKDVRAGIQLLHAAALDGDKEGQFWLGKFFAGAEAFTAGQQEVLDASAPGSKEETDPAKKAELAKAVIAEIRAMRKIAKENKVRRVQGLPPLPLKPSAAASAASTSSNVSASSGEDDYSSIPLLTNKALAYKWYLAAASQDHADAQVALGNLMMADGDGKQAIWWYEVAAQVSHHSLPGTLSTPPAGGPLAAAEAVVMAVPSSPSEGGGAAGNDDAERAFLAPAAPNASGALPHPDALYNLGMAYWDGVLGVVPKDRLRAAAYFKRAADLFDPSALFWLGYSHHNGDKEAGIPRDSRSAMRYLELAAGSGHPGAAHYLARLYRNGDKKRLNLLPNRMKSDYFLRMAADAGHAEALFELADSYFHGGQAGVERDYAKALSLYERAASLGHVRSMVSAGAMYYHGLGLPKGKDYAKAHQYYTEAGERGSVQGWENVAAMLALGEGVPRNESAAKYIRTRVIPQMLEQQAAQGDLDGAVLPGENDDDEEDGDDMPSSGDGGGCGKPTCKSGGCGSKKAEPAAASGESSAAGQSKCKSEGGAGCGGNGSCNSKSNEQDTSDDSGDFVIQGSLYRASDPAPKVPTTQQGSGDSPDDPIVLDLTNPQGVIAALTNSGKR
jgi:TPR repeat protein